jgi:poly-gamma-glutamate capsule biosynthesis protein CapA/YwtB (metallophosphatase superfamily)
MRREARQLPTGPDAMVPRCRQFSRGWHSGSVGGHVVRVFLCGDVMTGRGVDQILPHPGDPRLREAHVSDARVYVRLAERVAGPIPQPAGFGWPWGDALTALDRYSPHARVINLETSITCSSDFAPGKAVHYRMNPANIACLAAARPDACALANNHTLDFGRQGLAETLTALSGAAARPVGAGQDPDSAHAPAVIGVPGGRVLVFSCGTPSSGIPSGWAVTASQAGVDVLPDESESAADHLIGRIQHAKRPRDIVVVSLHWGSNWGYDVPGEQVRFAHRLVDGGADLIHGHSSHHPRPIEVYRDRLILYGCGDCIDDYEGISGYEEYRDDLRLLYFATVSPPAGTLTGLHMVPMKASKMRLGHATVTDTQWLAAVLQRISRRFGTHVESGPGGMLTLRP